MTFAIPKCPILVVCAAAMCFISKVDPDHYFLPSVLFKEMHGHSKYGGKDFINDNNDEDGWSNNNLRIGVQDDDETKKESTVEKLEKFMGADKARNPEVVASMSSSRKNTEVVEVVVAKSVSKEKNTNAGDDKKSQPMKGGESSQLRKKQNKEPERTGKPLFILHVGPPKTGTTTLQCELGEKFKELKKENFYYLGTYYAPLCGLPMDHVIEGFSDATRPVLLGCYAEHTNKEGCDLERQWKEFEDILLSHKDHNVIMSDEMFHHLFVEEDVKRLAKILNPYWDVRILYTYRHFYSTIPSLYHQVNDPYATEAGMPHAHEKTLWPEDGGYKIRSFGQSNYFKIDSEMKRFNSWADSFKWVQVFNMHNTKRDYLPAFLCTMIPESKALCQDSKNTDASNHKDNDSSSKYLHFDMLAVEAHEQGLLKNSKKTRAEVRDAVQEFCKSKDWSFQHFPLNCLSEPEMESFLHESLEQAHILQPYFANPRDDGTSIDSEIRSGFQSYREKKKFCSVNAKRTLEEYPWRQFFLKLE